jgi:hypothetical protein
MTREKKAAGVGVAILVVAGSSFAGLGIAGVGIFQSASDNAPRWVHRTAASVPLPNQTQIGAILRDMVKTARLNGETHPTGGILVATSRGAFEKATGGGEVFNGDPRPVWVAAMRGNFTMYTAPHPSGVSAPQGNFFYASFDPATWNSSEENLEVVDAGLIAPVDMTQFGPWTQLDLSGSAGR